MLNLIETRWVTVGDFKARRRGEIASREQANSELIETRKKLIVKRWIGGV